jgi:hypothetical protein
LDDTCKNRDAAKVAGQPIDRLEKTPVAVGADKKIEAALHDKVSRECKPGSAAERDDRRAGQ